MPIKICCTMPFVAFFQTLVAASYETAIDIFKLEEAIIAVIKWLFQHTDVMSCDSPHSSSVAAT